MQQLTEVGEAHVDEPAPARGTATAFIAASSHASLTRATTSARTYDCAVHRGSISAASSSIAAAAPVPLPAMLQSASVPWSRSNDSSKRRWTDEDGGGSSHSSSNQRRTRGCTAASWPQQPITNADAHPRAFCSQGSSAAVPCPLLPTCAAAGASSSSCSSTRTDPGLRNASSSLRRGSWSAAALTTHISKPSSAQSARATVDLPHPGRPCNKTLSPPALEEPRVPVRQRHCCSRAHSSSNGGGRAERTARMAAVLRSTRPPTAIWLRRAGVGGCPRSARRPPPYAAVVHPLSLQQLQ